EIVDNTITSPRGGGATLSLLRVVNTKGTGSVLVEGNTVTGGVIGLSYSEGRKSVPAVLRRNVVRACSDRGILVSGGIGVRIEENEVRDCGPSPRSAGLHVSSPRGGGVVAERNLVENVQGVGI